MFGYWLAGQKMFGHVLFGHVLSFNHPCFEPHFDLCQFKPTKHYGFSDTWKTLTSDFLGVGGPGSTIGRSIADML
jgi:hypothetical protein